MSIPQPTEADHQRAKEMENLLSPPERHQLLGLLFHLSGNKPVDRQVDVELPENEYLAQRFGISVPAVEQMIADAQGNLKKIGLALAMSERMTGKRNADDGLFDTFWTMAQRIVRDQSGPGRNSQAN